MSRSRPGNVGAWYGLPEGVLPGGTYASTKLVGPFADIVARIAPTFAQDAPGTRARPGALARSNTTSARAKLFFTCRFHHLGTSERLPFSPG
mgnify:CR=1 FL=1